MSISASLQAQITALQNRIGELAATATPEQLGYIGKAIESIAGQVSAVDLAEYTVVLKTEINAEATTAKAQVTTEKDSAVSAVHAARDAATAAVQAAGLTTDDLYGAVFGLTI